MFLHNKSYYAPPALGSKGLDIWLWPSFIPLAYSANTNKKTTRSFSTYSPTTDMVVTSKNKTQNTRRFLLTCYASGGATLGSSPKQTPKMETLIQSLLLGLNMTAKARKPFVCAVGAGLQKKKIKGSFVSMRNVDTKNRVVGMVVIPTKPCAQRSGDGWNTFGIPTITHNRPPIPGDPTSSGVAVGGYKAGIQKYNLLQTIIYQPTTYVGLSPLNNKSASDGWHASHASHASRDNPQDFYTPTANSPVLGLVPVTRSYSLTGQNAPIDLGHRPKSINKTYKTFLSYWLLPLIGLFTAVGGVDKTSYAIVCRDASEATLANGFYLNPLTPDKFCLPTLASGLSGHKQQSKAIELMAQSAMSYQKKPFLNQLCPPDIGFWVGPNEMTLGDVLHTPPKKSNGPALDLGLARVFTHSYLGLPFPTGKSGLYANTHLYAHLYANTHHVFNKKTSYALKTTNNLESSGSKSVGLHAKPAYANQRSGYIKDTILNWPAGQNQQLLPKSPRNKFTYGQGLRFSKPTAYTLFDSAQTKNHRPPIPAYGGYKAGVLRFKDITTYNKQTPVTSYKDVLLFLDSLIQKLNWNTFGLTYPPTSGVGKTDWRFVLGGPRNQSASTSTLQSISKINNTPMAELLSDDTYSGYMAGFAGKPKTYHINSSIFKLFKNYLIKGPTDQKQDTVGGLINTNPLYINPQYKKQTSPALYPPAAGIGGHNKKLAAFVGGVQSSYNMLVLNNMLFPESGFEGFGLLPLSPNEIKNQNLGLGTPLKPTHVVVRTQRIPIITASWGANDVRTPKYVDLNIGSSFKVATLGGPTKDISTPEAQGAQLLAGSAQNVYSGANYYGVRANKTNYVPTYGGPTIHSPPKTGIKQNNLNPRLNLSSTKIKSIKGNKSFSNYIKYLRTNLNKLAGRVTLGQTPHIKLNKYNTTQILSNYLPKNNTSPANPLRRRVKGGHKNTIFLAGLSDFVSTRNVDTKNFGQPEAAHNNMRVRTTYAKGVYPTKVQNAIPIVLQHKKLLGVLPTVKLPPNILKNGAGVEPPIYQQNVKAGLHAGRANLISAHGGHALEELNKHKKDMQKKRKAKKQRLEGRRKKKRKRFYPRPNWLRLRLGLWVSEKTYLVKKGFKGVHHVNTLKLFSNSGPLANNAMRVANYSIKPSKLGRFDLYPRVAWIQKESFNNLNNYITTLSKSIDAAPQAGLIKQRSVLISPFSNMPNNASPTRTYQLASKNTLYNNMVYNLWLASKKTSPAEGGTDVNKPTSPAEGGHNKISLLDGLGGRQNSILPQAEYAKQSSKKKKTAYGDYSKISTYNYSKKLLMSAPSAHQILTTFKNKASYATFEEKSNQNIPKKEINKNNLRDFWIWLYNITNTSNINHKMYMDNMLNYLSIPIISANFEKAESGRLEALAQNHQQMSDTPVQVQPSIYGSLDNIAIKTKARKGDFIKSAGLPAQKAILSAPSGNGLTLNTVNLANWSLNKTNLWSSTTQRMNYWSTQKLRNQSKNNKTKYIEKQLKKLLSPALYPSAAGIGGLNNLFTNLVARKALHAGVGTTVENPTTPNDGHNQNIKSSPALYPPTVGIGGHKKHKLTISQKMHQKEIKLSYITSGFTGFGLRGVRTQKLSLPIIKNFVLPNANPKSDIYKSNLGPAGGAVGFLTKPSTISWFEGFDFMGVATKTKGAHLSKSIEGKTISSTIGQNNNNRPPYTPLRGGLAGIKKLAHLWPITICALLLHFSALISLISISQIRCFIKFHFILLYKLSNIYLQLIYGAHDYIMRTLENNQFINSIPAVGGYKAGIKISKPVATWQNFYKPNKVGLHAPYNGPKATTGIGIFGFRSFGLKKQSPAEGGHHKKVKSITAYGYPAYGGVPWYCASGLKLKYSGAGKPNKNYNPNYLSSYGGMRNLLDSSILGLSQFKGFVKNSKKASAVSGYTNSKITIAAGNKKASPALYPPAAGIGGHKNIVKLSNFLIKLAFFLPTAFNRFYMGFGIKKPIYRIQNQRIGVDQQVVSKPVVGQVNILTKYLIYQNLVVYLKTKTMSYSAFGAIKKGTYNTSLQIVDTFEYFLRIIYGFFEKPAELTMDWIAYAFLVEWSSDLLTFTPENKDKQNWLAFSKIARQNKPLLPILSAITFAKNNNFMPVLYSPTAGIGGRLLTGLSNTSNTSNTSLTIAWGGASFILSLGGAQFIYKRILYLNDMFIEILNRPDTDLIYRQKKGTLFWEIWSDILIKAADRYNINIPSLSNIKEEQNVLIDRFLSESSNVGLGKNQNIPNSKRANLTHKKTLCLPIPAAGGYKAGDIKVNNTNKITYGPSVQFNRSSVFDLGTNLKKQAITIGQKALYASASNIKADIKGAHDYVVRTNTEFVTYKSKETDLFLDYHPPKSFIHLSSIQYYSLVQPPIGTLVCQIYSGILNKQISKNILVIGSTLNSKTYTAFERMQKTLLIQALAGETEIKIITDNAHRYAIVNRGFAVGIKLLKDVFEALALNTPCLFLLEDIHLIGERRPLLISDNGDSLGDEMGKATEVAFGAQRNGDAVHEKNQVLYQFNRHGITHYQKPFKGDFSAGGGLSIPTNHFSLCPPKAGDDLFFKTRYSNFSSTPTNPLAYLVDFSSEGQTANSKNNSSEKDSHAIVQKIISQRKAGLAGAGGQRQKSSNYLSSSLQLTRNQLLSPPSTSPFTVLLLKEQKKLKPKKIVKELPWVGLPSEQLALLPRVSYSVRAKVAALADLSFSNMSAKFDMITDLLVIIDSVRGNRGFVVFATTHLPHILDPALRRPGRLDETISIPTLSNIWNRWEFTKAPQPVIGLDCFWPPQAAKNNQPEKHTIGLSTTEAPRFMSNNLVGYHGTLDYLDFLNLDLLPNNSPPSAGIKILSPILTALPSRSRFNTEQTEQGFCVTPMADMARMPVYGGYKTRKSPTKTQTILGAAYGGPTQNNIGAHSVVVRAIKPEMGPTASKQKSLERVRTTASCAQKTNNIAYYQMGRKFIRNLVVMGGRAKHAPANLLNFSPIYNNSKTYNSTTLLTETREFLATEIQYKSIYSSTHVIKNTLIGLISGKFSELFAFKTIPISKKTPSPAESGHKSLDTPILNGVSNKQATGACKAAPGSALRSSALQNLAPQGPYKNHTTLYGIDETWRAAMSLALSFVQKRYLYNKNLIVPKLLNFLDYSSLEEAPSPPASNILIPAKRYENYKKVFKENLERKVSFDINGAYGPDKIEKHIKQSFIQSIYKNFKSPQSLIPGGETKDGAEVGGLHAERANKIYSPAGGGNKIAKLRSLALLETPQNPIFMQTTNITWYYQNKLLKRHKNYLTNQWWNGQLIEHNAETLFLSDIDWRYTFYSAASGAEGGAKKLQNTFVKNSSASKNASTEGQIRTNANGVINKHTQSNIQDILLDFPDSDQHYNPKHRRWMLNAGYWSSWFSFCPPSAGDDKKLQTDILNHFIFECFITSYNILNRNRELLDYSVTKYIQKGLIKEINVIHILQKF